LLSEQDNVGFQKPNREVRLKATNVTWWSR